MTRATRAKWLALATVSVVVLLAAFFAALRNRPAQAGPAQIPAGVEADRLAVGRSAYDRLNCATCHSIEGRGNPANALDGVGARLDRSALRDFTTGTGAARERLGTTLARRKARALDDPDLGALIDYLAQLK